MRITDRDAWTCPDITCGETVRGTAQHRRAQQREHGRRHDNERKQLPCRDCGKPFSPVHDANAEGPTVRHPYFPVRRRPGSRSR